MSYGKIFPLGVLSASGVAGAIQFSNGSAFASDAANLFWDDPNNRLGIGTNAPTATTHIKGSGSTSATTSLLVQNGAGTQMLIMRDDGNITFGFDVNAGTFKGQLYIPGKLFLTQNGFAVFGDDNLNASAVLQANSTTKGFLPPRMTNAQRGLITTPAIGLMVYCTDAVEGIYVYKSTGWTFVA